MSLIENKAAPGLKTAIIVSAATVFGIDPSWQEPDPLRPALGLAVLIMWFTLIFAPGEKRIWRILGWLAALAPLALIAVVVARAVAG